MPRSKNRRATPRKPRSTPDLSRPIAANPVEAEANGLNMTFEWRGIHFVVDIQAVKFGKAAFSLRIVGNDVLPLMTRMNAAIEVLESAIGQEQLMKALDVEPDFFDDIDTMKSFWDAYTTAVHGAPSGESQAS